MFHQQIIDELKKFESGTSDATALERWLLSNYQHILDFGEKPAIMLASELNALFVEQGENIVSEEELEFMIREILRREAFSISLQMGEEFVQTAAVCTVRKRLQTASQVTDVHLNLQAV